MSGENQTTVRAVPDQPPLIRAALRLADYAVELRAQGHRCEMAEQALEETPEGMTRCATWVLVADRRYKEMLAQFDVLAQEYTAAKVASITTRNRYARRERKEALNV
jgi:hypothetical protein